MKNTLLSFSAIIKLFIESTRHTSAIKKFSWGVISLACIVAIIQLLNIGSTEVAFRKIMTVLGAGLLVFIFTKVVRPGKNPVWNFLSNFITFTATIITIVISVLELRSAYFRNGITINTSAVNNDSATINSGNNKVHLPPVSVKKPKVTYTLSASAKKQIKSLVTDARKITPLSPSNAISKYSEAVNYLPEEDRKQFDVVSNFSFTTQVKMFDSIFYKLNY